MSIAGYLKSDYPHYIDHILPLCSLLDIPLIVTSKKDLKLCNTYYPDCKAILQDDWKTLFSYLANNFDTLIECCSNSSLSNVHFEFFHGKKMNLVLCTHGMSDKFLEKNTHMYIEPSKTNIITYGKKTKTILEMVYHMPQNPNWIFSGDFRKHYFEKNLDFYTKTMNKMLLPLDKNNKTILYAPTWSFQETNTSFFSLTDPLIDNLPDGYNLIIKPHPSIKRNDPAQYYKLVQKEKKNCLILEDIPIIYPLLARSDIYLGDFSSIGYNFTFFERPMFFFDVDNKSGLKRHQLFDCGIAIPHSEVNSIYTFIDKNIEPFPDNLLAKQKKIYRQTFDNVSLSSLKKRIFSISKPNKICRNKNSI